MISIIIPVLNEGKNIEKLLRQVKVLEGDKEIVVVDGGSTDNTVDIADKYARVIHSKKGRANQMNKGAQEAKGNILWFVHSDSLLDPKSLEKILKTINDGYIGGGFSLYFYDYPTLFMKYVAWTSNLRARYMGLLFGDQGIFVEKDIFFDLGGYPEIGLMEDWEFSKKLFKTKKVKVLRTPIGTSARRFKSGGQFRTFLLMQKIKLLYVLGTPPDKLKKIYREAR